MGIRVKYSKREGRPAKVVHCQDMIDAGLAMRPAIEGPRKKVVVK